MVVKIHSKFNRVCVFLSLKKSSPRFLDFSQVSMFCDDNRLKLEPESREATRGFSELNDCR